MRRMPCAGGVGLAIQGVNPHPCPQHVPVAAPDRLPFALAYRAQPPAPCKRQRQVECVESGQQDPIVRRHRTWWGSRPSNGPGPGSGWPAPAGVGGCRSLSALHSAIPPWRAPRLNNHAPACAADAVTRCVHAEIWFERPSPCPAHFANVWSLRIAPRPRGLASWCVIPSRPFHTRAPSVGRALHDLG